MSKYQNTSKFYCKVDNLNEVKKLINSDANDKCICLIYYKITKKIDNKIPTISYIIIYNVITKMQQQFYECCEVGDLDKIKKLIEHNGADFCSDYNYAVKLASYYGNFDVVLYLLNNNLCNSVFDDRDFVFCWASADGNLDTVKYLVNNFSVDIHCYYNFAVRVASKCGKSDVVKYLVNLGVALDFDIINNLYSNGHFDLSYELIHNSNCEISDNDTEQFNYIKKSVCKIIKARKWNNFLLCQLNLKDLHIQFSLSQNDKN